MPGLWITAQLEAAAGAELDDDEDELDFSELPEELSDDFDLPAGLLDDESDESDESDDELDESLLELDVLLLLELFDTSRLSLR